jgi:hypothetical protein
MAEPTIQTRKLSREVTFEGKYQKVGMKYFGLHFTKVARSLLSQIFCLIMRTVVGDEVDCGEQE